ncbi:hypothetical protein BAE44_0000770, partial [Dichanthelium oligosanthes]
LKESSSSACGVVIRDHRGMCLMMASRQLFHGVTAPEILEALALRSAIALAREEGFHKLIFQSDCLTLIKKVNAAARDRSITGSIVAEIKSVASSFVSVVFSYKP